MRWVNRHVRRGDAVMLGSVPILLLVLLYLFVAAGRHAANPMDKVLPLPGGMAQAMSDLLFQPDQLTGQLLFWADTFASLQRLGIGLGIATAAALVIGLVLGVDRFLDMCRTALNVTGDLVAATVIAAGEKDPPPAAT